MGASITQFRSILSTTLQFGAPGGNLHCCCELSTAFDDSDESHILKLSLAQITRHSTHSVSVNQYAGRFLHWHHSAVRCYCLLLLLSVELEDKESHPLKLSLAQAIRYWRFSHTHAHTARSCKTRLLLLCHPHRSRYRHNYEMGVGPAKKQCLNTAFRSYAWSADDEQAGGNADTSFRVDSTAIGARVSVQGELTCTNGQVKRAKHVAGSRDSTWQ